MALADRTPAVVSLRISTMGSTFRLMTHAVTTPCPVSDRYLAPWLLLCLFLMLGACGLTGPKWTYPDPPRVNDYFKLHEKIIWCDSEPGAQFTAITGWFGPGCQYSRLKPGHFKVTQLTHKQFETTKVIIVRCLGEDGEIWLPLPSHKWA